MRRSISIRLRHLISTQFKPRYIYVVGVYPLMRTKGLRARSFETVTSIGDVE